MRWFQYIHDLLHLFFPVLCKCCGRELNDGEVLICTHCHSDLPYTDFHFYLANPLARQLWGRVPINASMALLFFMKMSNVQYLIHNIKYKREVDLGVKMGNLMGIRINSSPYFYQQDFIIPIPLHPKKLKKRGYNQSALLAKGIAEILKIPTREDLLVRIKERQSQTAKNRFERFTDLMEVFSVPANEELKGKTILLVDDVFTTGATIEACALKLLESGVGKINIATLAFVK